MDRVKTILHCQWRAYWRRFARHGHFSAGNQGILLLLGALIFFRYIQALKVAGAELWHGKSRMLENLLLGLFLAWLFPLFSNSRVSITPSDLKHFPLLLKELFVVKTGTLFIAPISWMIITASLALVFPLLNAPSPVAAVIAALLFFVFAWLVGLTVSQLVVIPAWRKILFALLVIVSASICYYVVRNGSLSSSFIPARLVARAALSQTLLTVFLALAVLVIAAVVTTAWSFKASVNLDDSSGPQPARQFIRLFGLAGGLSTKDFRYYRRLLDPYFGLLASGLGCLYFVIADTASPEVFWIFILIVFFPSSILSFNSFGLDDRSAMDRYALLPLSGKQIMFSKNQAYVATLALQLLPLFLFALWRLAVVQVAWGIIEAVLLSLAYLTWGNILSVTHRFRMQFYRFSSGGSPIDGLVGVFFGTLPGAIAIKLFPENAGWVSVLIFAYGAMYWGSLIWSGRKFERSTFEVW
jgi:hypothetical protein